MIDEAYVDRIKKLEGYAPKATWDYKQYSGGYGTRAEPGETFTPEKADARMRPELAEAYSYVQALGVPMTMGQAAALTSLTYNSGPGWTRSGLGAAVKNQDWNEAKRIFLQYNKAGGETLPGLVRRRAQEVAWLDEDGDPAAIATGPAPATTTGETAQATSEAAPGVAQGKSYGYPKIDTEGFEPVTMPKLYAQHTRTGGGSGRVASVLPYRGGISYVPIGKKDTPYG